MKAYVNFIGRLLGFICLFYLCSALTISNIQAGSTGNWGCHVQSRRGNNTRTVDIVVLESSAQYCPPERVVNNKGDFRLVTSSFFFFPKKGPFNFVFNEDIML